MLSCYASIISFIHCLFHPSSTTTAVCLLTATPPQQLSVLHTQFSTEFPAHSVWFSKHGLLPYAYVIPKQKDISRYRPLISYCQHPCAEFLHLAAQGLMFLFKHASFMHFNLLSTTSVLHMIDTWNSYLLTSHNHTHDFVLPTLDVSNLYTELPHADIFYAVTQFFYMLSSHPADVYVSIDKHIRGCACSGRSKNKHFLVLSHQQILQAVYFEMTNNFFTLGADVLLHQIMGVAMGGYLSPGSISNYSPQL